MPGFVVSRNENRSSLLRCFRSRTNYFGNSFFPYCVNEWNKLDPKIRELKSPPLFKKSLLRFIRPKSMSVYNIVDPCGLKLLSRLRVGLSHLKEHKYRHNFGDTLVPICNCGLLESENTTHFLIRCTFYSDLRKTLFDSLIELIGGISNLSDSKLLIVLLYGDETLNIETNSSILQATISFLKASGRFDIPLISAQ
jgi:hypothetical protein